MSEKCPVCATEVAAGANECQACGFRLVGATQKFQAVAQGNVEALCSLINVPAVMKSRLHVVKGPQIGATYELVPGDQVVGRSPHCQIFLNDMTVSRKHARIYAEGNDFVIEDTNSFNGLWVNNRAVAQAKLKAGDEVQIGVFCLVFEQD